MGQYDFSDDPSLRDSTLKALLSGGISGSIVGSLPTLLSKGRPNLKRLLQAASVGGGIGATAAGGSTLAGSAILGTPDEDEPSGYTRRGALGGAAVGGTLGGALGALAGSGKVESKASYPYLVRQMMDKLGKMPKGRGALLGALGGAGVGALGAAASGADEGMQLDVISHEMRDAKRRKMRDIYG